jgi:inhibitor of KinA sporulation pathway (predicted exonuclease)
MPDAAKTILIVDVEALCWDKNDPVKPGELDPTGPPGLQKEIIELGCALYDVKSGGVVQNLSVLVKPRFGKVSAFCTQLTGWTQADVDSGQDIEEALHFVQKEFKMDNQTVWASYGEYDRWVLGTGERDHNLTYYYEYEESPFTRARTHFNVKTLFALKNNLRREMGLDGALKYLNTPFQGRHHNGADDALNISTVLRSILKR